MSGLDAVEWEACVLEPVHNRDAERFLRKAVGFISPGARYFLGSPWLTRTLAAFNPANLPLRHIKPDFAGMIALVVSQENSCRYCYTATRTFMLILGFPEERIRNLEENAADLSVAQRAALDFARCVGRSVPLATCREAQPLLDAGFEVEAVQEIAVLAALNVFHNRLSTLPALPPAQMKYTWFERLMRPLIASKIMSRAGRGGEPLRVDQRQGPFAAYVNALGDLPVARPLRQVIDDAWRPSSLSLRLKELVFAVVARGIGCASAERETTELLIGNGLTRAEVEQVLAHLSGADLDPLERAAISLARESIWYSPASVQRHVQSIRPQFSSEQFVELIGIISLANTICRLSVVVDVAQEQAARRAQ